MRFRYATALLLLFPMTTLAITIGGGGDARPLDASQTYDFDANPAATAGTYVATQADGKLKGIKRIAITNFCVQFVVDKGGSASSSGSWVVYSQSASASLPRSLDAARLQALADAFLDRIESDLKAAGIDIVPYEEVAANDLYKKFTAKYDTGMRSAWRSIPAGKGGTAAEQVVFVSPRGRPFAPDCGTISPASTSTFVRASYPLNAEFLTGSAVIDLGTVKAGGKLWQSAQASVDYVQHLRAGDSQYQFVGKMGPGARVWLKQSIVPPQSPFTVGEARKGETTKERDEGITQSSTTYSTATTRSVEFDEERYFDNAQKSLEAMNKMFLQKITAR
jgi:hypothetical protein